MLILKYKTVDPEKTGKENNNILSAGSQITRPNGG
jgi:hypothetical protein